MWPRRWRREAGAPDDAEREKEGGAGGPAGEDGSPSPLEEEGGGDSSAERPAGDGGEADGERGAHHAWATDDDPSSSEPGSLAFSRECSEERGGGGDPAAAAPGGGEGGGEEDPSTPSYDAYGFSVEGPWGMPARDGDGAVGGGVAAQSDVEKAFGRVWDRHLQRLNEKGEVGRTKELLLLVRAGVPSAFRGRMWVALSRCGELKARRPENYYTDLLMGEEFGQATVASVDIEKDVRRTFPGHRIFQTHEGLDALRRVLVAYSVHNKEVGYCQSLNYICAVLLLFVNEEDAFWLLDTMITRILPPRYYTPTMDDSLADQRCLADLVKSKMPDVHRRLHAVCTEWQLVSVQWFLCLWVNCLPLETTLRVWDVFFYEGSATIFRIALAIMRQSAPVIIAGTDATEVMLHIREAALKMHSCEHLFATAFGDRRCRVHYPELQRLRRKHGQKVGKGLYDSVWLSTTPKPTRTPWKLLHRGKAGGGEGDPAVVNGRAQGSAKKTPGDMRGGGGAEQEMGKVGEGEGEGGGEAGGGQVLFKVPAWHAELRGALLNVSVIDGYLNNSASPHKVSDLIGQQGGVGGRGRGGDYCSVQGAWGGGKYRSAAGEGEGRSSEGAEDEGEGGKPLGEEGEKEEQFLSDVYRKVAGGRWWEEGLHGVDGGEVSSDDWSSEDDGVDIEDVAVIDPVLAAPSWKEARGRRVRGKEWDDPAELHAVLFEKIIIDERYCL